MPPEPPGGGGGATDPRDPDSAWGWEPAGKSRLLSLLTAWLGDMEGFSARDAQGELPSSGSRPTGSVPQDLVRVCKNQRKHTSRDLDVSIRNPAYTAGPQAGPHLLSLFAVSRRRGWCSHRRRTGAGQPPTASATPDLVGTAIAEAGFPACHCTAAECPHPPTATTRLLRTKDTGGGSNVEAPTRQDRAGTECVPAHLG